MSAAVRYFPATVAGGPLPTAHALLRWLERVRGHDFAALRARLGPDAGESAVLARVAPVLVREARAAIVAATAFGVSIGLPLITGPDAIYVVDGRSVITVIERDPGMRRQVSRAALRRDFYGLTGEWR